MKMRLISLAVAVGASMVAAAPAHAADRVLVSAKNGADTAGCGTPAAPCRTFQFAHDAVGAGGVVAVLDPGDYAPLRITKAISIVNDGAGAAGVLQVPAGTNGIIIDGAATDRIYLRGLTIDAPAGGLNGVLINTAGTAIFTELHVRHYVHGVNICPLAGPANFLLSNSYVSDNTNGVSIMAAELPGSVVGLISHVVSSNNSDYGIHIDGDNGAAPMKLTISDSVFSNNPRGGVVAVSNSTATSVTIRNVVSVNSVHVDTASQGVGFGAFGASVVLRLAQSVAAGNNHGVKTVSGGVIESHGDNDLRGNIVSAVDTSAGGSFVGVANQ